MCGRSVERNFAINVHIRGAAKYSRSHTATYVPGKFPRSVPLAVGVHMRVISGKCRKRVMTAETTCKHCTLTPPQLLDRRAHFNAVSNVMDCFIIRMYYSGDPYHSTFIRS
jgi:hypothetical protein